MSEINYSSSDKADSENAETEAGNFDHDTLLEKLELAGTDKTGLEPVIDKDESSIEKHEAEILREEKSEEYEKEEDETDFAKEDERSQSRNSETKFSSDGEKTPELTDVRVESSITPVESFDSEERLERKGTDSADVTIGMAEGPKPTCPVVITTAPTPTGPPKPKPKLVRRKSLNPRVMAPPGLEVLDNVPLLAIRQQMDMDIQAGCGAPNTYKVWDENDEQIFFATEESGCLCRWACGPARQFSLDIFSAADDQVLNFHRTCCRCDCCCCLDCFMCLQKLYVVDCLGRTLGAVKQKFSVFNAKFDIVDHDNNVLYKVLGPCCPCRCSTEIYFQILNKTGERQIGRIQKKWGGDRTDSINVDHEYFDITFPAQLDSVDKGLILGAAFLVVIIILPYHMSRFQDFKRVNQWYFLELYVSGNVVRAEPGNNTCCAKTKW